MTVESGIPALDLLIEDLRRLRAPGLLQLRRLELGALHQAARRCGYVTAPDGESDRPSGIEAMLHAATDRMGSDNLGLAARYTFGLVDGTRDWAAQDRRNAAAKVYRVGTDRFRKYHEKLAVEQLAEQILGLCRAVPQAVSPTAPPGRSPLAAFCGPVPVEALLNGRRVTVSVHALLVELLSGVDIVVSSENIYLELSKTFQHTVSGSLRRAAAARGPAGEIVADPLAVEVAAWMADQGRQGLPVRPGTVVATSTGELSQQGIRRIYHAAVAEPQRDGTGYQVSLEVVSTAVRNIFDLAERERPLFEPPLTSICFPLLGAGRGGLTEETSIRWLWWSICQALTAVPNGPERLTEWEIHLVTPAPATADLIARVVAEGVTIGDGATPWR
jgi:O-acetyl-ADP-ribose deacetylase (regulator of RNase III)